MKSVAGATLVRRLEELYRFERSAMRPGVEGAERLLERGGRPDRAFPSVLIAGTNGKGSTAAHLASIFRAAGLKTGLYTSPHLVRFHERIRVDGREISDEAVEALLPEPAELVEPIGNPLEARGLEPAGAELRRVPTRDHTGLLQHLEVLGNSRLAQIERRAQLRDRRLSRSEAGHDRASGRVGERGQGRRERVGRHRIYPESYITYRLCMWGHGLSTGSTHGHHNYVQLRY